MVGSKLRQRRNKKTVSVISKDETGAKTNEYTGLTPTFEDRNIQEEISGVGLVASVMTVFFFEPLSSTGSLPVISEEMYLSDGTNEYQITQAIDMAGNDDRLKIETMRIRI
jgi:hypothetical protein